MIRGHLSESSVAALLTLLVSGMYYQSLSTLKRQHTEAIRALHERMDAEKAMFTEILAKAAAHNNQGQRRLVEQGEATARIDFEVPSAEITMGTGSEKVSISHSQPNELRLAASTLQLGSSFGPVDITRPAAALPPEIDLPKSTSGSQTVNSAISGFPFNTDAHVSCFISVYSANDLRHAGLVQDAVITTMKVEMTDRPGRKLNMSVHVSPALALNELPTSATQVNGPSEYDLTNAVAPTLVSFELVPRVIWDGTSDLRFAIVDHSYGNKHVVGGGIKLLHGVTSGSSFYYMPQVPKTTQTHQIQIDGLQVPPQLKISAGDTVTWKNTGQGNVHAFVSVEPDKTINEHMLRPGQSFSFTFTYAGQYRYACSIHEYVDSMHGVISVSSTFKATASVMALQLQTSLPASTSTIKGQSGGHRGGHVYIEAGGGKTASDEAGTIFIGSQHGNVEIGSQTGRTAIKGLSANSVRFVSVVSEGKCTQENVGQALFTGEESAQYMPPHQLWICAKQIEGSSFVYTWRSLLGSKCGNGIVEFGEECDDGNMDDADGCLSTCRHGCSVGLFLRKHGSCDGNIVFDDRVMFKEAHSLNKKPHYTDEDASAHLYWDNNMTSWCFSMNQTLSCSQGDDAATPDIVSSSKWYLLQNPSQDSQMIFPTIVCLGTPVDRDMTHSCSECPVGKFQDHGTDEPCKLCPEGKFGQMIGSVTGKYACDICPSGKFSAAGDAYCRPCVAGSVVNCPSGYYQTIDASRYDHLTCQCTICPSGKFGVSGKCGVCPQGYYSGVVHKWNAAKACTTCPSGKYQEEAGKEGCSSCPAGYFQKSSSDRFCKLCRNVYACPAGYHQNAAAGPVCTCTACPVGYFRDAASYDVPGGKMRGCVKCPFGKYQDATKSSTCKYSNCPAGKFYMSRFTAPSSESVCHACPAGKYGNSSALDAAENNGSRGQNFAAANTKSSSWGIISKSGVNFEGGGCSVTHDGACVSIQTRAYTYGGLDYDKEPGAQMCSFVHSGNAVLHALVWNLKYYSSSPVPVKSYLNYWDHIQIDDSAVYYSQHDPFPEAMVVSGTVTFNFKQQTYFRSNYVSRRRRRASIGSPYRKATICAQPTDSSATRPQISEHCVSCPFGYHQAATASVSCQRCKASATAVGSTAKFSCAAGEYSANSGSCSCSKCPTGYYQQFKEQTSCLRCPLGKYQIQIRSSTCNSATPGKYASWGGKSNAACPGGKYQPANSASSCLVCTPGKFSYLSSGSTQCGVCPSGYFQSGTSQTTCSQCPSGKFQGQDGASFCYE